MSDNSQDITMGNQQERLLFKIGYLIGIIDGEGSCQFGYKYLYKGCKVFTPKITIYNTNPAIILQTKTFLDELGFSYYCYATKMHGKEQWLGWRVELIGLKRIKELTDLLLPYPSGKKERLQVLNDFCTYRLSKNKEKYAEEDQKYFIKLRDLNRLYRGKRAESSETTRFTV